jgi:hypothetical protein
MSFPLPSPLSLFFHIFTPLFFPAMDVAADARTAWNQLAFLARDGRRDNTKVVAVLGCFSSCRTAASRPSLPPPMTERWGTILAKLQQL